MLCILFIPHLDKWRRDILYFGVYTMPADALAPEVTSAWYMLFGTDDDMYFCSRVNFIYLGQTKSKKRFKM